MPIATAAAPRIPGEPVAQVFMEHAQFVFRTAYGVTGSHEDAEDVLQTVFLRLIRRELSPDFGANPRAYLYRAAVNAALDVLRSLRGRASSCGDSSHRQAPSSRQPTDPPALDVISSAPADKPPPFVRPPPSERQGVISRAPLCLLEKDHQCRSWRCLVRRGAD